MTTKKSPVSPSLPDMDLSPLDHIRQTEAEMTRAVAAARESTEKTLAGARNEAAELKRQAREAGLQEGQAHTKTIISQAEDEARVILVEANDQAKKLRQRAHQKMEQGVGHAINIILGLVREAEEL